MKTIKNFIKDLFMYRQENQLLRKENDYYKKLADAYYEHAKLTMNMYNIKTSKP